MRKNGDANNNPKLIMVLGIIFTLIGILVLGIMVVNFNYLLLIVGGLFLPIGVLFILYGNFRRKKMKAYQELLNNPNAYITNAKFIKATFSSYAVKSAGVNGLKLPTQINIYKKITYEYKDESGVIQKAKSLLSYTPNQVRYLKQKNEFKIKCKGNLSVIIEEIPEQNSMINV